jgi:AraC-like DNA-binding protein
MAATGAYGQQLGERFRLEAPAIVSRALYKSIVAVTNIVCDEENHGLTEPFPYEDAFLVALQIKEIPHHELWFDDRPVRVPPWEAGTTSFYDLKRNPIACLGSPSHCLMFYIPRKVLDAVADDEGAARIDDLHYTPGIAVNDPTMRALSMTLLPTFEHPEGASRLFVDSVTMAVVAHVAQTYGGMRRIVRGVRGGLAAWQERRSKELIHANLNGEITATSLARECGLSTNHFSRAFRQSTGLSPHQWLLQRRIDAAKACLRDRDMPLSEVALACGFTHQSHFTRIFTRCVGVSPGVWRRSLGE